MAKDYSDSAMLALLPADPGKLTVDGGLPPEELHCTLVFLGEGVQGWSPGRKDALRSLAQDLAARAPIETHVFSHSVWNKDRAPNPQGEATKPCVVYQLRDPAGALAMLVRAAARRAEHTLGVDFPKQWEPHLPHIAAAYDEGDADKLTTSPGPVRLTVLRLAIGEETYDYPLSGDRVALTHGGGADMADSTTKDTPGTGTPEVAVDETTGKLSLHWPVLVIEGLATGEGGKGNGRLIPFGSLGHRALPLPVAGQVVNDQGHKGAEIFGKITKLVRHNGPDVVSKETGEPFPEGTAVWEAWGEGDATSKPGKLALDGYLTGNSADLTETTVEESLSEDGKSGQVKLKGGKIGGTTLVPIPAFADGFVEVNGKRRDSAQVAVEPLVAAAWTVRDDPEPVVAAAESPFRPSLEAFQPRTYIRPTALEVTDFDGYREVHGHIADFGRTHISFTGKSIYPPRNTTGYKAFNTGALPAVDADGTERTVAVGRLVIGGGHADLNLNADETRRMYDDASTAWAYVQASDDAHGIQVNGVVAPGVADELVVRALAHPQSGDWRPMDGRLELVASLCVNTAGFPVARALVADGQVCALVAAGALAPEASSPAVLVEMLREMVAAHLAELREHLSACGVVPLPARDELEARRGAALLDLARVDMLAELGVTDSAPVGDGQGAAWRGEHLDAADSAVLAMDAEALANWVEKTGGLPPYIGRIEKHLTKAGMAQSRAIATAVKAAKKMCATGDTNWPGKQEVNAGSRSEACAAVAQWNANRARARAD